MFIMESRIACISAPSVYQKLKQLESQNQDGSQSVSPVLLEFDRRFAVYSDEFIFYDYNNPLCLPEDVLSQSFDIVVADPPYLSEECLSKVALTVKYLTKSKILLCTGQWSRARRMLHRMSPKLLEFYLVIYNMQYYRPDL